MGTKWGQFHIKRIIQSFTHIKTSLSFRASFLFALCLHLASSPATGPALVPMGSLRWCHRFDLDGAPGRATDRAPRPTAAHRCARPHRAPDGRALCRKRRDGFSLVPPTPGGRKRRSPRQPQSLSE